MFAHCAGIVLWGTSFCVGPFIFGVNWVLIGAHFLGSVYVASRSNFFLECLTLFFGLGGHVGILVLY
jgi:hypothetical protein